MSPPESSSIDWNRFGAVLFDLDGVLTDTASLHAEAWKQSFDEFLRQRAGATGEALHAFDIQFQRSKMGGFLRLATPFANRSICYPVPITKKIQQIL